MKKVSKIIVFTLIFCFLVFNKIEAEGIITKKLKIGDRNSEVKTLQEILIKNGYLTGTADGSFGKKTQQGLKLFQTAKGLYPDGIAGPKTRTLLLDNSTINTGQQQTSEMNLNKNNFEGSKKNSEKIVIMGGDGFFYNKSDCFGKVNCMKDVSDVWISSANDVTHWTKLKIDSEASWARRHSFATSYFNKSIILTGGLGFGAYNDTWSSNNNGKSWVNISKNNKWIERGHHSLVSFKDKLWLLGGEAGQNDHSEIWNSSDGKNWSNITYSAPWGPRYDMAVVVFNNKLWLIGGYPGGKTTEDGHMNYIYDGDVWSSSDGINWQKEVEYAPWGDIKYSHAGVVFGGKIYVIGGSKTKLPYPTSIIDEPSKVWSSRDGINWKLETENPPWGKVLFDHQVIAMGDRMYILGGALDYGGVPNKSIWSSKDGATWTKELENTPWVPRTRFQAIVVPE